MNISELARRLGVGTEELRAKLPELGFDIGSKAIKIPDRDVGRISDSWKGYQKRLYLQKKMEDQKARAARKLTAQSDEARVVELPLTLSVREFSETIGVPIAKVMQELMRAGILASLNERIDFETAAIIAEELGLRAVPKEEKVGDQADLGINILEDARTNEKIEDLQSRPPVIVVMGHVDHGKTMLLDAIRSEHVIDSESGGITQHIGAYQVVRNGQPITFIDTPGHEAFTVMRSRGAKVADIAILVVAADDGIQPQTKEAINIIKAAKLPFVVAINKIDKEGANLEKVKSQLAENDLVPEDWGGKTICVPVSAKAKTNIDQLLDMLLLVRDIEKDHITANPNRPAIGTIIEAHIDKGAGPVSTVMVQTGTLKVGDSVGIKGVLFGKVRAMKTWDGKNVKVAPPSTPVQILGLKAAPSVGDILEVPADVKSLQALRPQAKAKTGVEEMSVTHKQSAVQKDGEESEVKPSLNLVLKADVLGSLEALIGMIEKIDNPYVRVQIVAKGLGNLTDSEVLRAEATGAFIALFNVKPTASANSIAREKHVEVGTYTVIYKLFDEVVEKLKILIPAEKVYTELGTLKVLGLFKKLTKGIVLGGQVLKGKLEPGATVRVMRGDKIIEEGKIESIQVGKTQVREVQQGEECGLAFIGKGRIEIGDILEAYKEEMHARTFEVEGSR